MYQGCVMTPISVQCLSCKCSHASVLADLTTSALPAKKEAVIVSWLVSRPHLACLLDSPANKPGVDILHMVRNLYCYYHPPPASVSNSNAIITAFVHALLFSAHFVLAPSHIEGFKEVFFILSLAHCVTLFVSQYKQSQKSSV